MTAETWTVQRCSINESVFCTRDYCRDFQFDNSTTRSTQTKTGCLRTQGPNVFKSISSSLVTLFPNMFVRLVVRVLHVLNIIYVHVCMKVGILL